MQVEENMKCTVQTAHRFFKLLNLTLKSNEVASFSFSFIFECVIKTLALLDQNSLPGYLVLMKQEWFTVSFIL